MVAFAGYILIFFVMQYIPGIFDWSPGVLASQAVDMIIGEAFQLNSLLGTLIVTGLSVGGAVHILRRQEL